MADKKVQVGKEQGADSAGLFTEIPPSLVPRLGDYLLQQGLIQADGLQRALAYQSTNSTPQNPVPLGQALLALGLIERSALDRAILRQSLSLQAALEEANRNLEERVQQRTQELEKRLVEIRTATEITQLAISSSTRQELLKQIVELLVERFDIYLASIFMVDEAGQNVILVEAAGKAAGGLAAQEIMRRGFQISIGSQSMVGVAAAQNQARWTTDVSKESNFLYEELLPETHSEASIPLSSGGKVWGILDIQQSNAGDGASSNHPFDEDLISVLQIIANHIAAILKNFDLLELAQASLKEVETLFHASHQIAEALSKEEVLAAAKQAVSAAVFPSLVLVAEGSILHVDAYPGDDAKMVRRGDSQEIRVVSTRQDFEAQFTSGLPLLVCEFDQSVDYPACLMEIPRLLNWKTAAYIPVKRQGRIEAIFVFGTPGNQKLNQTSLQSFAGLAELTSTALTKLSAQRIMEKRMDALQTLGNISQAVSVETSIDGLYQVIHREVTRLMGEVEFLIANYDPVKNTIQIPYMYESGKYLKYDPFPLGEGLTSILISTRLPLMLVENTEAKAKELGAKVLGKPAKSWLGVPLIIGGEVIGAMIVQDLEHELRFDEDDQRMLSTLASQVAVAIRNARLLESTHDQAERERLLFQITGKIRAASDMQTILETTATELRKVLNARRADIQIGVNED